MDKSVLALPKYRYASTIIDGAIIFLFNIPIMMLYNLYQDSIFLGVYFLFVFRVFIYLLFDVVIPSLTKGQTIGRYIIKLRLIQNDYTLASFVHFLRRASIFVFISILSDIFKLNTLAYFLWVIVFVLSIYWLYRDSNRRTVHDRIASTVVVNDTLYKKKVN